VQIPWKQTLGLVVALGAMSCGDSEPTSDTFQGYIDASVLDSKFLPTGKCSGATCYAPQTVTVNSDPVLVYNLGLVANPDTTKAKPPPAITADGISATVYDFPDGCIAGHAYDQRVDAFALDTQYPVFSKLPVANTSSTAPAVLPLMKVVSWHGSDKYECNAIKSATSVDKGTFNLTKQEDEAPVIAMRAVISPVKVQLADGSEYTPPLGWYKGLLLNYLDVGQVPVDAQGNLVTMDGVLVNPATGSASTVTANNVLVLFARPGETGWSPVVKLREFTATGTSKPADYKSLCYDAPCAAGTVDMSKATKYTGTLFLTTGAP
jgi:hypothetical protein